MINVKQNVGIKEKVGACVERRHTSMIYFMFHMNIFYRAFRTFAVQN